MTGWAARRFWTAATCEPAPGGFAVRLDARPLRTPAKAALVVPTREMAEAISAEWDAQGDRIDPFTMPVTRAANATIDKVIPQMADVAASVAAYGASDLLCYRAPSPDSLVDRQADAWDPLLDWASTALGARLVPTIGIIPVAQDPAALAILARHVGALGPFALTALYELVALSGSLVIGLAAIKGHSTPGHLWTVSRIDEDWQADQWGHDEDAAALAERKRGDFFQAFRFWQLSQPSS